MTLCERTLDDLKAYLDGELRWPANWSVRRHLASCPGCRQELDEMRALQTRLRSADAGELPASLRARILAACGESGPSSVAIPSARKRFRPQLAWGTAAVVLLVAGLFGPYLTHPDLAPSRVIRDEDESAAKVENLEGPAPSVAPAARDTGVQRKPLAAAPSGSLPAKLQDQMGRGFKAKSAASSGVTQGAPAISSARPGVLKTPVVAPDQHASIVPG
jgi:anti-sigma factor RsiW